jgi:cytochrome c-type biogenesis protein CcmH
MTDWLSATAMILSGAIVGFMFWYGMKGRAARPDGERLDLEAKRDVLLQQLRELKETGGSAGEQRRLERETADVLRRIDQRGGPSATPAKGGAPVPAAAEIVAVPTRGATLRGFVYGVLTMTVLGGIGWFVTEHTTPKTEGTTGGTPMATSSQPPQAQPPDAALQQIEAAVAKSPDDLEMRNQLAKAYLEHENLMGVFEQTQYILQRAPGDARALTYQALVRMSMGQRDGAEEMLQRALKSDPELLDSYVALAWDDVQRGKVKEAEGLISEAGRRHPDQQARLAEVLARMKEQAKNPPPETASAAPAGAAGSAPVSGPSVHVTLSLEGAKPSPGAVLFIFARSSGQTAGPPAAVKRIMNPSFPMEIDLSAADSMMGQPLPATVRIEARLDSDGDAMTRNPSDPHAVQDGVATNGTKVKLVLK